MKVELSWNSTVLKPHMVEDKVLQLILPPNTKAYLASGAALTDMTVTIGASASGQLAALGGTPGNRTSSSKGTPHGLPSGPTARLPSR